MEISSIHALCPKPERLIGHDICLAFLQDSSGCGASRISSMGPQSCWASFASIAKDAASSGGHVAAGVQRRLMHRPCGQLSCWTSWIWPAMSWRGTCTGMGPSLQRPRRRPRCPSCPATAPSASWLSRPTSSTPVGELPLQNCPILLHFASPLSCCGLGTARVCCVTTKGRLTYDNTSHHCAVSSSCLVIFTSPCPPLGTVFNEQAALTEAVCPLQNIRETTQKHRAPAISFK